MPTFERAIRENEQDNARNEADRKFFEARRSAPSSVRRRFGTESSISAALAVFGEANWKTVYLQPDGQIGVHENHDLGRRIANQNREANALRQALDLKAKYGVKLFDRRQTAAIAKEEGISEKTVRRMRERLAKNGQA